MISFISAIKTDRAAEREEDPPAGNRICGETKALTERQEESVNIQEEKKTGSRLAVRYLAVSAFCLLFSVVYSLFSHGIHSPWMRWLAAWPFVLGAVPALILAARRPGSQTAGGYRVKEEIFKDIYRFGIAAVTVASLLKGILEIAGTDSLYPTVLLFAGAGMLLFGAAGLLTEVWKKRQHQ